MQSAETKSPTQNVFAIVVCSLLFIPFMVIANMIIAFSGIDVSENAECWLSASPQPIAFLSCRALPSFVHSSVTAALSYALTLKLFSKADHTIVAYSAGAVWITGTLLLIMMSLPSQGFSEPHAGLLTTTFGIAAGLAAAHSMAKSQ